MWRRVAIAVAVDIEQRQAGEGIGEAGLALRRAFEVVAQQVEHRAVEGSPVLVEANDAVMRGQIAARPPLYLLCLVGKERAIGLREMAHHGRGHVVACVQDLGGVEPAREGFTPHAAACPDLGQQQIRPEMIRREAGAAGQQVIGVEPRGAGLAGQGCLGTEDKEFGVARQANQDLAREAAREMGVCRLVAFLVEGADEDGGRAPAERQARAARCRPGVGVEDGNIGPTRNADPRSLSRSRHQVEAFECAAQPPGLDAHDGIHLRVEIGLATEHRGRDGVALDALGPASQRFLDDVAQELPVSRGRIEGSGGQDPLQLRANRVWREDAHLSASPMMERRVP